MPSNEALANEVQDLLEQYSNNIMFCLNTPASLAHWITKIEKADRKGLFDARRFLMTEMGPAITDFRKLFCMQSESVWLNDFVLYSSTNEVMQLRKRMLKIRSIWSRRPKIRCRGKVDAVQKAARKARIYNPSETSIPDEVKGVAR